MLHPAEYSPQRTQNSQRQRSTPANLGVSFCTQTIIILDNGVKKGDSVKQTLDLILHPVRLRIMQALALQHLTTQQIDAELPDIAASSIYRHLRLLLENGMLRVVETRPVKGTEEKVYALAHAPRISDPAALAGLSPREHIHYFTMYAAALIGGFADYINTAPEPDYLADRVGYTEAMFYATQEEMDAIGKAINDALLQHAHQHPDAGRTQRKLSVIVHPVREEAT
jgi:DNA-binding transcriptional ArsR family regulator